MVGIGFVKIGNAYIPVHEIRQIVLEKEQGYIWTDDDGYCTYIVSAFDVVNLRAWLEKQVVLYLDERQDVS